jgi:hypothetical protein
VILSPKNSYLEIKISFSGVFQTVSSGNVDENPIILLNSCDVAIHHLHLDHPKYVSPVFSTNYLPG